METIEQQQDLSVDKSGGISTENDSVSIEEQPQESNATAITEDRSLTFCEDKFGRISTENDSVSIEEQTPESKSTAISTEDRSLTFCQEDCCWLDRTEPYQPQSKEILQKTKRIQGQGTNQQARYRPANLKFLKTLRL